MSKPFYKCFKGSRHQKCFTNAFGSGSLYFLHWFLPMLLPTQPLSTGAPRKILKRNLCLFISILPKLACQWVITLKIYYNLVSSKTSNGCTKKGGFNFCRTHKVSAEANPSFFSALALFELHQYQQIPIATLKQLAKM